MKNYINWAILAPGNIAASMALAMKETAKTDSRIRLYAVASRDSSRANEFAKKWGFSKAYASYDELLQDKEVDAVYIANPHSFHYTSTLDCLKNGKHVLCEKPAGCNIKQLNTMIKMSQKNKLFFMEAMWTAFNPCILSVCEFVAQGGIGELGNIQSFFCNKVPYDKNSRMWAPELAGGALLDLGIYNIYVSSMINQFCKIKKIDSEFCKKGGVDAWENVNIKYKNGVFADFESACDRKAQSQTHDAIIMGSKGFIVIQNFFFAQKAEVHIFTDDKKDNHLIKTIEKPFNVNGYEYELIHATDCILQGKTESNVHTFKKSRELIKTMDKLRKSWKLKYPFE